MLKTFRKTNYFRKGAGEMVSFSVCILIVLALFLTTLSMIIYGVTMGSLDDMATRATRAAIVEKSYKDAEKKAEKYCEAYMKSGISGSMSSLKVTAKPASAKDKEWKKGNFLNLEVSVHINTISPFVSGEKKVSTIMMIEHNND